MFTVNVGNLPPQCSVVIKVTYVAELPVDGDRIVFRLPNHVAPWKRRSALDDVTQSDVHALEVDGEKHEVSVQVRVEMPFDIRFVRATM